ncbi:MAG: SRPBCC domain-containing protein [Anaerolineales bacterium]|nr:MAG: SRPBCC domain-containing protein [Anaerolineales bacterium]
MRENRDEIIIQAAPEEVWDVLTDLGKHAEWNPLIYRAEGKIELGEGVRLAAKSGSIDMNYNCSVVKVEPNREFQWKWHIVFPFLFRGEHTFTIEPIDGKSIRFINVEIFKGILVPLFTNFLATDGKDGMVAMDEALKDRVEQAKKSA